MVEWANGPWFESERVDGWSGERVSVWMSEWTSSWVVRDGVNEISERGRSGRNKWMYRRQSEEISERVTRWGSEWPSALMIEWASDRVKKWMNELGNSVWVGARTIKQSVGGIYFPETTSLNEKEPPFLIEENLWPLRGTCHSWKRNQWIRDLNESRAVEFPETKISTVLSILCHLITELRGLSD
jgi:hypothetical protein